MLGLESKGFLLGLGLDLDFKTLDNVNSPLLSMMLAWLVGSCSTCSRRFPLVDQLLHRSTSG